MEPLVWIEQTTYALQVRRSTNWAKVAYIWWPRRESNPWFHRERVTSWPLDHGAMQRLFYHYWAALSSVLLRGWQIRRIIYVSAYPSTHCGAVIAWAKSIAVAITDRVAGVAAFYQNGNVSRAASNIRLLMEICGRTLDRWFAIGFFAMTSDVAGGLSFNIGLSSGYSGEYKSYGCILPFIARSYCVQTIAFFAFVL